MNLCVLHWTENHTFFSRRPEKMVFPKKSCWSMIFLILSGKMIFLFPENMILPPRRKMKDDISQKKKKNNNNNMETWYFLLMFWKDGLFKKTALEFDLSCFIWKGCIFSPRTWIFSSGQKRKDDLSQEVHGNMKFSLHTHRRYKHETVCLRQKKYQRWCYPTKIRSTVIDILDWHCRKCFNNSLYFYGDLWSKKTPRNLIYRIELWLSFQIIRLEIFYNEESLILCFIQLSEVVFRGLLERQSRKLFVDKEMVIIPKIEERRWKLFNAEVDQTFLKVHAKNLVKVTRTREVMGRKRPPTLRKLSLKFHHKNGVIEARYFNYANNYYHNKHGQN